MENVRTQGTETGCFSECAIKTSQNPPSKIKGGATPSLLLDRPMTYSPQLGPFGVVNGDGDGTDGAGGTVADDYA